MKKKQSKILKKCRSSLGETLIEVMVAMLVGVFSCLMLSQVIAVSTDMNADSREVFEEYYEQNNKLTKAFAGENSDIASKRGILTVTGVEMTVDGVTYKSNLGSVSYWANYYVSDAVSGSAVVVYRLAE